MPIDWKRVGVGAAAGFALSAALYAGIRAYTGIFDVLNVRIFVAVILMLPAVLGPTYGFNPAIFKSGKFLSPPWPVCAATSVVSVLSIVAGEFAASLLRQAPVPWGKFNLICLLVAFLLPFQLPKIFRDS
ncbi:MAG: hypothetical protein HY078_13420 [Elusimicrobia bacterium]|nr:hypothetical protein [Elusimicrobiota bacterium]